MSAPVEPLRIGLVGYGKGGRHFHAPLIEGAGCVLAGVVTRNPLRQAELAADRPGTPAVESIAELADLGAEVIVLSTPVTTRGALAREAMGRGLPVLCDKPFAPDADDARELVEEAELAGVLLSVYQNRRWDADFLTVRKVVASGALGDLVRLESTMDQLTPPEGVATTGGGMLRDLGAHQVDQALRLLGPAASVHATVHARDDLGGLDDQFTLVIRHTLGRSSHLSGGQASHGDPVPRFRVVGTAATYTVPPYDGQADALLAGETPATLGDAWGIVPQAFWGQLYRHGRHEAVPSERGDWCELYRGLARSVREGSPPPVAARDAVATLEVLDAAWVSATQDRTVHLDTSYAGTDA
jgi:predicted dehydrogenase